jgi:hypothetical protein
MKENLRLTLVTCLAYCVDKELSTATDYLREQVPAQLTASGR